ncbi:MAG: hypothetical protein CMH53_09725 [Myxococcales bacterium]|nr:hypothetical protein [Myxococcales bacterium]
MSSEPAWHPLAESDQEPTTAPSAEGLLAVDLGLKTGLAYFTRQGRLVYARTRKFSSRARLKNAIPRLLADAQGVSWLVLEGDSRLAQAWIACAKKSGINHLQVTPEQWRSYALLPRERRSGVDAKDAAKRLALEVMRRHGTPRHSPLQDDAAEAVLIGQWALARLGWTDAPGVV